MTRSLSTYQAKRDFTRTAEPSGAEGVRPSERPRFVIQKHDATRLHYDFRLEHKGVFLSWAVTRGPSLDPKERRLAVEVEDHPLDYGDFEGTIPKGEYGGGTVMLWDRGFWAPEPGTTVDQGLKKGDLKIVLEGERLHGGWVLVRMDHDRDAKPGRKSRTNWLLIKHRDATAHDGDHDALLTENATSVASGRSMEEIAAGKGKGPTKFITAPPSAHVRTPSKRVWNSNRGDPEASAEAVAQAQPPVKTAKPAKRMKTEPATLPTFVEPQLARVVDHPPSGAGWAHEIKFDGYRLQLRTEGGKATVKTRKGLDWSARFPEICADAAGLPDGMVDGEAVALDDHGSPDFAGLQAALSNKKTGDLVFFAFDQLFDGGDDLRPLPLSERKARLKKRLSGVGGRLRYVEHFETGGDAVLKSACSMHLEGIVSKRLDAPYQSGRSDSWTKSKCRGGQEVVIAGWTSEGAKSFRSLLAAVNRDGKLIYAGRIGTGFSAAKVAALIPRLKAAEGDRSPFDGQKLPYGKGDRHWLKTPLVAEIESAGWTGEGLLRQASFKALREDKPAGEVMEESPERLDEGPASNAAAVKRAASAVAARGVTGGRPVVMGVSLSSPDKVLWPAAGDDAPVTKMELARYYEAVGEAMLPHIAGRPCSIIRMPDGIEGETFFQRHTAPGSSALVTAAQVGERKPYIQLDRVEAIVSAAQTGGVELHPWNCGPNRYDVAGRLVFDLDPAPDVAFEAVIAGAREVKARLEALGLEAFCKTTGGKGLHVVTPLDASGRKGVEWPTAKAFARTLCERMAADSPDRYLVSMAKAKRTGKIFLDYLRNDRLSTAVAPFSPRGRPHAPVSWPLTWAQVKPGLDPLAFRIATVPKLLVKSRAWDSYDEAARPAWPGDQGARQMTWEDVGRIACELPGVEAATSWGTPAYKVKKALLVRLKEDGESIVLFRSFDEKEFLLEAAPEVFFQTDHYRSYPALLARLDTLEERELRRILADTWWNKAPKSLLKAVDQGA